MKFEDGEVEESVEEEEEDTTSDTYGGEYDL